MNYTNRKNTQIMHIISFILNDAARVFSSISDTFWFWIYLKWLLWRWWGSIIEYILQDKYRDNDGAGGDIRVQVKLNVLQKISMEITMALVVIYECGWNWWVTEFLLPPCPRRSCGQTSLLHQKYIYTNTQICKHTNTQIHPPCPRRSFGQTNLLRQISSFSPRFGHQDFLAQKKCLQVVPPLSLTNSVGKLANRCTNIACWYNSLLFSCIDLTTRWRHRCILTTLANRWSLFCGVAERWCTVQ